MNSIPAASRADWIFDASFAARKGPSLASNRFIVGIETLAAIASCSCDQAKSARAAFSCLIDTFSIDFLGFNCNTFSID